VSSTVLFGAHDTPAKWDAVSRTRQNPKKRIVQVCVHLVVVDSADLLHRQCYCFRHCSCDAASGAHCMFEAVVDCV
jgi:hypothetical protein